MDIIHVLLVLIAVGVALWLVNTYVPMAASVKAILNAVVVVFLILWLLQLFGIGHYRIGPDRISR